MSNVVLSSEIELLSKRAGSRTEVDQSVLPVLRFWVRLVLGRPSSWRSACPRALKHATNSSQPVICSSLNAAFGGDQHLSQVLPAHASVVGGCVRLELLSAGETADDDGIETGVAYECGDKL
jgi:hypothetical protein